MLSVAGLRLLSFRNDLAALLLLRFGSPRFDKGREKVCHEVKKLFVFIYYS